jgi:tryptophan halogenase
MDYSSIDNGLMAHNNVFERQDNGFPALPDQVNFGYHVENVFFVAYLESYAASIGVIITDDTVERVEQNEAGISALLCKSGQRVEADLYVDASGFVSELLGKTLKEPFRSFSRTLFCDRAVVGGWTRNPDEPIQPYTTGETMDAGWCFQIEHENHVNRGYVFSSAFITPEEADREFRRKNPRIQETRLIKMIAGNYHRGWVKNVVAVGNSAGFVEPLEATAIGALCRQARGVAHALADPVDEISEGVKLAYNRWQAIRWDLIRNFLAIHYRLNTALDTPFWRACRNDVDMGAAAELLDYYKDGGPDSFWMVAFVDGQQVYEIEGYLTLLLGLKVPYRKKPVISPEERAKWEQMRASIRTAAINGVPVREAQQIFRRPEVNWGNYFKPMT